MKRHYDLVFAIGRACTCSQSLRKAGLQLASFPWDWVGVPGLKDYVQYICSDFKDWPTRKDLEWLQSPKLFANKKHVICHRTGLFFLHDFNENLSLDEQYPAFAEKYARRIARLYSFIRSSKKVLAVCIDSPHNKIPTSLEDGRWCRAALCEKFPGVRFDFLQMTVDQGRSFKNRIEEELEDGFFHFAWDYRDLAPGKLANAVLLDQVGSLLASRFSVRDYRTKEDKAAYAALKKRNREMRLRERMAKFGAETRIQYELLRVRKALRSVAYVAGPRALIARARQKKFPQIVIMGSNCETAFRFLRRWGFVDSSLFAWAKTRTIPALTTTIRNLDRIPDGPFRFNARTGLWANDESGQSFHGRMKWHVGEPLPSQEQLDEDLKELRSRMRHLVEKFQRYTSSGIRTLFVRRLSDEDANAPDLARQLDDLEAAFVQIGARDYTLLLVCRRSDLHKLPPATEHRVYRCVNEFNPPGCATLDELGDPVAWNAIFTEFAPAKILPKEHDFKFE